MAYETILVERDERVGIITLNRPKALNALNSQVMNEVTSAATELDNDRRYRGDHHHRFGQGVRRRRRHQGNVRTVVRRCIRRRLLRPLGQAGRRAHPDHRRCCRIRARRRLRAGDDVRPADRSGHREVRPAGDQTRGAPGHGRLAAVDPGHRQGQGDGPDPDRTHHRRRGSRTQRTGFAGGAGRRLAERGQGRRDHHLARCRCHPARWPKRPSTARSNRRWPKDFSTSAGSSTRHSPPTTSPKAWRPSSKSARPTSPTDMSGSDHRSPPAKNRPTTQPAGRRRKPRRHPGRRCCSAGRWWVRHYTYTGTTVGLIFVWLSLTPSLLPRGPLFQGVVSGFSGAIGYGLGVFAVWLVRYMRSKRFQLPRRRRGRGCR